MRDRDVIESNVRLAFMATGGVTLETAETLTAAVMSLHDQEIAKAVAEERERMREHYRPAVRALAYEARWDAMAGRVVSQRGWLTEHQIVGPLADECIAAVEAES